eukprot:UN27122
MHDVFSANDRSTQIRIRIFQSKPLPGKFCNMFFQIFGNMLQILSKTMAGAFEVVFEEQAEIESKIEATGKPTFGTSFFKNQKLNLE